MPSIRSCLKIRFQGATKFIICEGSNTFEEVISQAMTCFGIPEAEKEALILTNGKGYVFESHLLEYFLLLFPCPEITFQLRYDWQRLRRSLHQGQSLKRKLPVQEQDAQEELDYEPVAVYRQNCFLGSLPSGAGGPDDSAAPVHRQNGFRQQQQQLEEMSRSRMNQHEEDLEQREQRQAPPKPKRLRMEACNKPRRTASSTGVPAAPLPMRSIRI